MKFYAFSIILVIISSISSCFAELYANEYHFEGYTEHSHDGCNHKSNDKIIAHKVPVGEKGKFNKRNRTPVSIAFEGTFDCEEGTKSQCKRLEDALEYANNLFNSIFDFYETIKVKLRISNKENLPFIAQTAIPPFYTLRDPNTSQINAYAVPLVKQLNIDTPIKFNEINEFDISITVNHLYLEGTRNIQPTIIHELLHGLGIITNLLPVKNGDIGELYPQFGSNYYMPKITVVEDKDAGKKTIKGFLPLNTWEKNFVDYDEPSKYYFDNVSFNNICELEINFDMHDPMYITERNKLKEFNLYLEQWTGMEQGEHFYKRSHESNSIGFKTHDDKVILINTYAYSEDSDLMHLSSPAIVNNYKTDSDWENKIDQNFILYSINVKIDATNEEKIQNYGKGKTIGLLSTDIISILETMGYHRKGTAPDNTVYQLTNLAMDNTISIVDGGAVSNKTSTTLNSSSSHNTSFITNTILIVLFSLIFIQLYLF